MSWKSLTTTSQLEQLNTESAKRPQVIFKHSTRCSISSMIQNRLTKQALPEDIDFYYLDLIAYRPISNLIAEQYGVHHESPQVLVIKNGKCVFHESHHAIYMDDIIKAALEN
ncbi:MAG: bacillithiol system redox-active protein YtxJ [Niabella sp.]